MSIPASELYVRPLPVFPCWIEHGVLARGGILLIGGPTKVGKSFLVIDLAHNLTSGGKVWGVEEFRVPVPATVLYVEFELGEYGLQKRIKERYNTLGTPPPKKFYCLSRPRNCYLDTVDGMRMITREIEAVNADVVIIDPISRALIGNENDNSEINRLFKRFDDLLAAKPNMSIVLSHHRRKGSDELEPDPLSPYQLRGASKFIDAVDSIMTLQKIPAVLPGELWRLKTGWELRQDLSPEGIVLAVYRGGLVGRVVEEKKALKVAGGKFHSPKGSWR